MTDPRLDALIQRWRDEVCRQYDFAVEAESESITVPSFQRGVALGRSLCAKELSAALAALTEKSADIDFSTKGPTTIIAPPESHDYLITYHYWKDGNVGGTCLTGQEIERALSATDALAQFKLRQPSILRVTAVTPVK